MPFFGHFRKRRDSDIDAVEGTVSEQDLDTEERQKRAVPFRRDNCPECLSICLMEVEVRIMGDQPSVDEPSHGLLNPFCPFSSAIRIGIENVYCS